MRAFGEYVSDGTGSACKARDHKDATDLAVMSVHGTQDPDILKNIAHTLGRNHGQENAVIAFSSKDSGTMLPAKFHQHFAPATAYMETKMLVLLLQSLTHSKPGRGQKPME